jgi:hypothetical protein
MVHISRVEANNTSAPCPTRNQPPESSSSQQQHSRCVQTRAISAQVTMVAHFSTMALIHLVLTTMAVATWTHCRSPSRQDHRAPSHLLLATMVVATRTRSRSPSRQGRTTMVDPCITMAHINWATRSRSPIRQTHITMVAPYSTMTHINWATSSRLPSQQARSAMARINWPRATMMVTPSLQCHALVSLQQTGSHHHGGYLQHHGSQHVKHQHFGSQLIQQQQPTSHHHPDSLADCRCARAPTPVSLQHVISPSPP